MKRLQIAYACNDAVFDGLYLSILSIVKRTKTPIDFYLFTADLTELKEGYISVSNNHIAIIKQMIKKYSKQSTFTVIDCKDNFYKRLNKRPLNSKYWTPYTTFRLLFDMFKQIKGTILYLDTDTLICGDIAEAFKVDMSKYELCVTKDIISRLKDFYFNAGVILMNMDVIRKTNYLEKAFNYLLEEEPKYCDQDALNMTGTYIKHRPDDRFNRIYKSREDNTIIKHFAGLWNPKPWKKKFERKYDKLNYRVWEQDIQEWKEMKSKL